MKDPLVIGMLLLTLALAGATGSALAADESASIALQEATPTPGSGGQVQLPTATPSPIGGPTATSTRTPTLVPVQARVIGDPTNLRTGPGIDFDVVAELTPEERLPITGRWLGYDWLQVAWEDAPEGTAWVYLPLVVIEGDITTIPAVEPPAPPTPDPTVQAALATATVLVQTPGALETATADAFSRQPTRVITLTPGENAGASGELPTFTPPPSYAPPEQLIPPQAAQTTATSERGSGPPPAVFIISLGMMGIVMLMLGLVRRLF